LLQRARQVAALTAGRRRAQALAEFDDGWPRTLADRDFEFA
jgi:hypothetical protein